MSSFLGQHGQRFESSRGFYNGLDWVVALSFTI